MPTYKSKGVRATLSLADLAGTLSTDLISRLGEQRRPAVRNRIERILTGDEHMPEYPIGAEGSERGVVQFIGPDEDMPLFAVEVRHSRHRWPRPVPKLPPDVQQHAHLQSPTLPVTSETEHVDASSRRDLSSSPSSPLTELDSSLLSIGAPSSPPARLTDAARTPSQPRESSTREGTPSPKIASPPSPSLDVLPQTHNYETDSKALVLEVEVGMGEYQNTLDAKIATDVKVEVWLNGSLVQVSLISRIRSGPTCVLYFAGTRLQQQAERPWVYLEANETASSTFTAQQRWETVGNMLAEQLAARDVDKSGNPLPSAGYLASLSQSKFPTRLKDQDHLGILDVVVTTGLGNKLTDPWRARVTPMASSLFKVIDVNNDNDVTKISAEHTPQTVAKSGGDTVVDRIRDTLPHKRAELEPTSSNAGPKELTERRSSRRRDGKKLDFPPDYFLKTPGQDTRRARGGSPHQAAPTVQRSDSFAAQSSDKDGPQAGSSQNASRGGSRSRSTVADMPEPFELPELCKGCAISYSGSDTQRLIPQSRPGEFDENGLVVGFRFVVV